LALACSRASSQPAAPIAHDREFKVQLPAAAFLGELDDRERREQLRDWGVLATLAHGGATPEQTAAATYQMPAARLPYLDELYSFSYGRGRRAFLGERVLLFVDADDPDRAATIGRLADQVRMELGEIPARAEIYVVEDQRSDGALRISRNPDVDGARLFSADYGYLEASVSDAAGLASWLAQIDDVARVRVEAGALRLGGRRFARSRTEGVALDDVAALYQAAAAIHDRFAGVRRDFQAEFNRRMAEEGYTPNGRYTPAEAARLERAAKRIQAELAAKANQAAAAVAAQGDNFGAPGFSLDPHWLPAADGKHPAMLARLQQLAADPCSEIARIAKLAPKLLAAEPDVSRRSGEAWAAEAIRNARPTGPACTWLREVAGKRVMPVVTALAAAAPKDWRDGFGPFAQLKKDLVAMLPGLVDDRYNAIVDLHHVLRYYAAETGAQCARYDGIEGTAVSMTLFYTDLLAKLWEAVDYGYSAPLRAIPGFLTSPRVDVAPAYAEELERLPATRIWFAPRSDAWTRSAGGDATELAFLHRFSRVYAAGSDPANPGKESITNEASRLTIGWWDRHFDDIADHEQQYHRQNQIMKWSAIATAMVEQASAPTFLASVQVAHNARFFPWLAAHRDRLRFQEPVPERRTTYRTECVALLQSYPYPTAGRSYVVSGGVSLADAELVRNAPTVNRTLPRGSRVVAAAGAPRMPHPVVDGRAVKIENAASARTRSANSPLRLRGVSARIEGRPGAPTFTLDSETGRLATVALDRVDGGVRIDLRAGPVEHVRSALEHGPRGPSVSFEARPERVVTRGDTLVEVKPIATSPDDSTTAIAHDTFGPGWFQARAASASEVHQRMDGYAWAVVEPGSAGGAPNVQFRNAPPPAAAQPVAIHGLRGITTARVANTGEVFIARPERAVRADWYKLGDRSAGALEFRPRDATGAIQVAVVAAVQRARQEAEDLARHGRFEEAAAMFEQRAARPSIDDRIHDMVRGVAHRNPNAVLREIAALDARHETVSPQTRSWLVDGLVARGDAEVAKYIDAKLSGKPTPAGVSLVADRDSLVVREARRVETFEANDVDLDADSAPRYFDRRLLVGKEGFEPDFGGPIARWRHDPAISVRAMKVDPLGVNPGLIVDTSTGKEYRRARGSGGSPPGRAAARAPAAGAGGPPPRRELVYVFQPRGAPSVGGCTKRSGSGSGSGSNDKDCLDGGSDR
jgi:hypothetical protein